MKPEESKSHRTRSFLLQSVTRAYEKIADRLGLCGINGGHFHLLHLRQEVVETALQIVQSYRMSFLLPRTLINRFYVLLLVVNCWSSVILYSFFYKREVARRRFACIAQDCLLDIVACMGVELIMLLYYIGEYNAEITGFSALIWYNDEWLELLTN
ncbi:hypothetical protein P3T76_004106 [Phytophthora citrophthora]|uniref:Uncharacterized protein n=1 Tax=Phytophthora citrophthora TaxID=4793 RepID=A0AAD9GT83_9STRA|nr:hypothetical protein P3T76_004106 [Phytophthora citrophthora]